MKISLPWSRLPPTQPINMTVSPILFIVSLVRVRINLCYRKFYKKGTAFANPFRFNPNAAAVIVHDSFCKIKPETHAVRLVFFGHLRSAEFLKEFGNIVFLNSNSVIGD